MHENDKALSDLNEGLGKRETIEGYFARARIYESRNDTPRATADFRRATELRPMGVFDLLAQAQSKQRIQQLTKSVPCGSLGRAEGDATCL
jgi:hypothetical protein